MHPPARDVPVSSSYASQAGKIEPTVSVINTSRLIVANERFSVHEYTPNSKALSNIFRASSFLERRSTIHFPFSWFPKLVTDSKQTSTRDAGLWFIGYLWSELFFLYRLLLFLLTCIIRECSSTSFSASVFLGRIRQSPKELEKSLLHMFSWAGHLSTFWFKHIQNIYGIGKQIFYYLKEYYFCQVRPSKSILKHIIKKYFLKYRVLDTILCSRIYAPCKSILQQMCWNESSLDVVLLFWPLFFCLWTEKPWSSNWGKFWFFDALLVSEVGFRIKWASLILHTF